MPHNIIVEFLDENGYVLAIETVVDDRNLNWKIPTKTALVEAENRNITIEWKKIRIIIERV